ncbi:transposable element tc3 transposase [Lasius niger]|uniref:Transposable element tc3 transposase n=1 Tax=Lasius niger TaxID=67767 RepID=A0A0J7MLV4_LASNI|nr:transposable element tc3 transposase [Lasius niger]
MTSSGLMDIVEISPHMNAEEYVEILEEVLKPSARQIYPEEQYPIIKIAQDNSAVHTSRMVQAWFEANPDFEQLPWPAKSPDLNPIENVWAKMIESWIAGELRTKEALRNHVHQVWDELTLRPNYTENLVTSMPRRLQLVIQNDGFWIPEDVGDIRKRGRLPAA